MSDEDKSIRLYSAQSLGEIGSNAIYAVPELIKVAQKDNDSIVRNFAIQALSLIARASKELTPELREFLSNPEIQKKIR